MTDINVLENQPIAWTPTPDIIERAQLTKFMRQVGVSSWDELYEFSIRDVEKFTEEVLKFLDIKFDPPYDKLLDTSHGIEFPKWFTRQYSPQRRRDVESEPPASAGGFLAASNPADSLDVSHAGLNITTMCLDRWQTDEMKDRPAVIWEGENGNSATLPYSWLFEQVEICSRGLRALGFNKGDAIGIHLPMVIDTIITLLAINRIGAIAIPVFSGYGVEAISSRLNAVEAAGLFTCDGFPRRGRIYNALETAKQAVENCSTIRRVFVSNSSIDYLPDRADPDKFIEFDDLLSYGENPTNSPLEPTSAEDPLIILYTSGTTGKPKGIAHTHASFPIKAAQDMAFGCDVGRGTRICWYTDLGWMMGPWLIYGALINGATICLYDGAPDYPTADRMWEFCARHKVEVLGISPTLVRSLAAQERSEDTPVLTDAASASGQQPSERKGWSRLGKLPHFDGEITQFITFRLADSIPHDVIEKLKLELERERSDDVSNKLRQQIEQYLDQGSGDCILGRPEIAEILMTTILKEDGKSCDLKAWVIMPNHAHLLLRMREDHDLAGMMKRIKGVSARKINEVMQRNGTVWQPDYFDRYIRGAEHFSNVFRYIENNPVVAHLVSSSEDWKYGSAAKRQNDLAARGDEDKSVLAPFERHDLSSLRAFGSTGEPWNPGPWWWLFKEVGDSKIPIINYSGGTEIAGGILMGNPLLPIKPCSFPAPCPGMDVDIMDENGEPVGPDQVGELVIKQPWIGMARGFWQEKERYLETYWSRFKNIWVHGDWAMRDEDGHWFILGRSDDTLKVAGKRVGPAEVESILVSHPAVAEAAVIGVPDEAKGTAMVAFVVISDKGQVIRNESSDLSLETELKALVSKDMGKPLAPSKVHFVSALPKTRNAKVMRRVLRAAYLGEDAGDLSSLENPASVKEILSLRSKSADI